MIMINWEKIKNTTVWVLAVLMIIIIGMSYYECDRSGKIEKNLSDFKTKISTDSTKFAIEFYGNDSIIGLKTRVNNVKQASAEAQEIAIVAKNQAYNANRRATALEEKQAKTEKELIAIKDSLNRLAEKQRNEALDFLKSQAAIAPPTPPAPKPEASINEATSQWGNPNNQPPKSDLVVKDDLAGSDGATKKHWRDR